jgi:hypothetical protein
MVLGVPKSFLNANVCQMWYLIPEYNLSILAVSCPVPVNPPFGRVMFNSMTYNSLISYECNYGYTIIGETVRRCERNKVWTGLQPICRGNKFEGVKYLTDPIKHQLSRNKLWISWNFAKWLVRGQPDNFTCCCHIQVGEGTWMMYS